jgi:hypothetical protein
MRGPKAPTPEQIAAGVDRYKGEHAPLEEGWVDQDSPDMTAHAIVMALTNGYFETDAIWAIYAQGLAGNLGGEMSPMHGFVVPGMGGARGPGGPRIPGGDCSFTADTEVVMADGTTRVIKAADCSECDP